MWRTRTQSASDRRLRGRGVRGSGRQRRVVLGPVQRAQRYDRSDLRRAGHSGRFPSRRHGHGDLPDIRAAPRLLEPVSDPGSRGRVRSGHRGRAGARGAGLPYGASQSSLAENGRTSDEVTARIVPDEDGNLAYEVTDNARMAARVPFPRRARVRSRAVHRPAPGDRAGPFELPARGAGGVGVGTAMSARSGTGARRGSRWTSPRPPRRARQPTRATRRVSTPPVGRRRSSWRTWRWRRISTNIP